MIRKFEDCYHNLTWLMTHFCAGMNSKLVHGRDGGARPALLLAPVHLHHVVRKVVPEFQLVRGGWLRLQLPGVCPFDQQISVLKDKNAMKMSKVWHPETDQKSVANCRLWLYRRPAFGHAGQGAAAAPQQAFNWFHYFHLT